MVKTSMFANSTTHQPTLDPMTCSHPKVAFAQLLPLASRPPWFPLPNSVRILCKPDGCVSIVGAQSFSIRMCCKHIKIHLILLLFEYLVSLRPIHVRSVSAQKVYCAPLAQPPPPPSPPYDPTPGLPPQNHRVPLNP